MSVTEIPELRIELAPAAEAVERAGRRLADLVSAAEEPERDVRGLEWTLHELVAHLAARSGRFAAYLSGTAAPEGEIAGIAEENRRDVAERRGRPVADLVEELRTNVASFAGHDPRQARRRPVPVVLGGHAGRRDRHRAAASRAGGPRRSTRHGPSGAPGRSRARTPERSSARRRRSRPGTSTPTPPAATGPRTGSPCAGARRSGFGSTTARPPSNRPRAMRTARSERTPPRWSCCRTAGSTGGGRRPRAGSLRPDAAPGARCGSTAPSSRRDPARVGTGERSPTSRLDSTDGRAQG